MPFGLVQIPRDEETGFFLLYLTHIIGITAAKRPTRHSLLCFVEYYCYICNRHIMIAMRRKFANNKYSILSLVTNLSCCLILLLSGTACHNNEDSYIRHLDNEAQASMSSYSNEGLDSLATLMLNEAVATSNLKYQSKAHFYLSYFSPDLDQSEKKKKHEHLDIAERIALEINNDTLLCYIYNLRGAWEMGQLNTATAQYWFGKSLEKARSINDRSFGIPAEMNLSETYRLTSDTLGISYDRNLFEYSLSRNEPILKFSSGFRCAMYYASVVGDTAELKPYIDAMRTFSEGFKGAIPMVYAQYFFNRGNFHQAYRYIREADDGSCTDAIVLHAEILNKLGKYEQSERCLDRIVPYDSAQSISLCRKIMLLRIANRAATGDWKRAFDAQQEYQIFRDSLELLANRDLPKRYRVEYEVYTKDREIAEQKMRIHMMVAIISAILILLLGAGIFYYLWNRRRNRFYHDIVRQNRESIERQNILEQRIAHRDARIRELETAPRETNDNSTSRLSKISDEKADEIFERIQYFADVEQIWRNVNITRDNYADMVGCNRTYFSEILKSRTQMSYSAFMNSCRIREAVKILSNPSNDIAIKDLSASLGFLTLSTFYALFKQSIGMSPRAYRKAATGK